MLRTSIAAVALGCCYICPLDCDAPVLVVDRAAVEARSMLEKDIPGKGCNKIRIINLFGRAAAAAAAAAAAHNSSTGERYYFFFLVAALLLLFTHERDVLKKIYLVSALCLIRVRNRVECDWGRTAARSHRPRFLLTTPVLKQREVPATDSSSYVSPLYTAMFRTSIAAVVLGCCYFCPLDCDAPVWWLTALLL